MVFSTCVVIVPPRRRIETWRARGTRFRWQQRLYSAAAPTVGPREHHGHGGQPRRPPTPCHPSGGGATVSRPSRSGSGVPPGGRPTTMAPAKQHEGPGWSPGRVRGSNTPRTGRSGEDAREGVVEFAGVVEDALGELVDGPVDRREVMLDPVAQSGEHLVAVPRRI